MGVCSSPWLLERCAGGKAGRHARAKARANVDRQGGRQASDGEQGWEMLALCHHNSEDSIERHGGATSAQ